MLLLFSSLHKLLLLQSLLIKGILFHGRSICNSRSIIFNTQGWWMTMSFPTGWNQWTQVYTLAFDWWSCLQLALLRINYFNRLQHLVWAYCQKSGAKCLPLCCLYETRPFIGIFKLQKLRLWGELLCWVFVGLIITSFFPQFRIAKVKCPEQ